MSASSGNVRWCWKAVMPMLGFLTIRAYFQMSDTILMDMKQNQKILDEIMARYVAQPAQQLKEYGSIITNSINEEGSNAMIANTYDKETISVPVLEQRLLLYITTQMSESHKSFLSNCWPLAMENSKLLKAADIMFFVSLDNNQTDISIQDRDLIHSVFPHQKVTFHARPNPGYQAGAILAMSEAMKHKWFDGYDWVVRVNPDVIIQDDALLLSKMGEEEVDGVFLECAVKNITCEKRCISYRFMHTDFFAVRPQALSGASFLSRSPKGHAERTATKYFQEHIVQYGRDRWLHGAFPRGYSCRAGDGKEHSPVLHSHDVQRCVNFRGDLNGSNYSI